MKTSEACISEGASCTKVFPNILAVCQIWFWGQVMYRSKDFLMF